MSKNISDNNNAAMLLMSHVRDVGDVKYLNKRSKATLYKAMLLMSEMLKIDQIHLRAVMLCMSKMPKMGKKHTHTYICS